MSKIRLLTLASMARGQLGNRTSGYSSVEVDNVVMLIFASGKFGDLM